MTIAKLAGALALGVGLACLGGLAEATPGLNEKIVADPSTGVALYGFDPVAYFTDGKAVRGRRDVEAEWNGAPPGASPTRRTAPCSCPRPRPTLPALAATIRRRSRPASPSRAIRSSSASRASGSICSAPPRPETVSRPRERSEVVAQARGRTHRLTGAPPTVR
ncbi:hypothetical protein [Chenggangzhangella methanolivorans]|uniref:hypothetical protein n=1 Tax=Chenggangzhangella methanolivorans TaxID=1437009 RepID=UPI0021BDD8C1|nr:hypothetical protein [Chenggangzhangella methanolivorans]